MEPIRIALIRLPRMLRDILTEIVSTQADMAIVADADAPDEAGNADFVIAGAERLVQDEVEALLEARPRMKVLAVAGDGRQTFLYELRPQMVPLGEVSPQTLLQVIRAARRVRA